MGTAGTSHYDVKGDMQVAESMSIRVPKHNTGTELFVVVKKCL